MKKSASPHDYEAPEPHDDVVSSADIEHWAEREKARRRAWLEGPTEEEKNEWAAAERHRRRRYAQGHGRSHEDDDEDLAEGRRVADRWQRDVGLALAGIAGRIMDSPYSLLGNLIREGRQLEDDYSPPRRRRRVPSDD